MLPPTETQLASALGTAVPLKKETRGMNTGAKSTRSLMKEMPENPLAMPHVCLHGFRPNRPSSSHCLLGRAKSRPA